MQEKFTKSAKLAIEYAHKCAKDMEHGFVGTEHILYGLAKARDSVASVILNNYKVTDERILEVIEGFFSAKPIGVAEPEGFSASAGAVLENASREAARFKSKTIGTEHLLMAVLKDMDCTGFRILSMMDVSHQKMYGEILAAMGQEPNLVKEEFQNGRPVKSRRQHGQALTQYSRDLTEMASEGRLDPVVRREDEINRVIQILSRRTKNNPCLIGEPGVGKTAVVEGLAIRIAEGRVPDSIRNLKVLTLDLSGMVAGSKYRGEFEERIKRIINEVKNAGNILLFIDEIHTIIGAGGAEGAIDAANILKPSLARGELQIIGATTISEYRKYFEKDAALERRFQPVNIQEPDESAAIDILKGLRSRYEEHHGVIITDSAIDAAVKMSERYINDRHLPDKAIDLIDEASSKVSLAAYTVPDEVKELEEKIKACEKMIEAYIVKEEYAKAGQVKEEMEKEEDRLVKLNDRWKSSRRSKKPSVDENDIADVVSMWTKIPVKKLSETESNRLKKLERILHNRVVGQDEAVNAVARAVKRGRVGLKDPKRPIGSFLFLGPTGVGKTELSKALAEAVFGDENSMIRIDMTEYMEKHSVSKIIGSPPGYVGFEEGGQLSEKVRRNPYSVILFDEIEKAHPDVFNILLQVLDDGHITDTQGRRVDFKNTIIIMTSNAGAERIMDPKKLGFGAGDDEKADYESMKASVMEVLKKMFKPEFLNRIDETIVFHALTKKDMGDIITIMLKEIQKRIKEQMNITLNITPAAKKYIVEKYYDKKYGARPIRRALQNTIEDKLAEEILEGNIKRGDMVNVAVSDRNLKFNVQ